MITLFPSIKDFGYGRKSSLFENEFKHVVSHKKYNVSTSSGSAAAFMLFDYMYRLHGKCNVFMPSISFPSPAWAALKNKHELHFVDVDDKLLFAFNSLRQRYDEIEKRHTVIMPISYGGDFVNIIPSEWLYHDNVTVILDLAHSLNTYAARHGDFNFYSFSRQKPIHMSTGGMISTDNEEAAEYFRMYRNFGRTYRDEILHDGFKFYMDDINASLGWKSLKYVEKHRNKRRKNFHAILNGIAHSNLCHNVLLHSQHSSYNLMTVILSSRHTNVDIIRRFGSYNIQLSYHYPPLHLTNPYYSPKTLLPYTNSIKDRIVNIPIHEQLSWWDIKKIIKVWNNIN